MKNKLFSKLIKVSRELESLERPKLGKGEYAEEAAHYFTLKRQQLELMAALLVQTHKSKDFHDPIVYAIQERVSELDMAAEKSREVHEKRMANISSEMEEFAMQNYGWQ